MKLTLPACNLLTLYFLHPLHACAHLLRASLPPAPASRGCSEASLERGEERRRGGGEEGGGRGRQALTHCLLPFALWGGERRGGASGREGHFGQAGRGTHTTCTPLHFSICTFPNMPASSCLHSCHRHETLCLPSLPPCVCLLD